MEACQLTASDEPASVRVEGFLACVETKRRQATQWRLTAAVVAVVMAVVGYMSSVDQQPGRPDLASTATAPETEAMVVGSLAAPR